MLAVTPAAPLRRRTPLVRLIGGASALATAGAILSLPGAVQTTTAVAWCTSASTLAVADLPGRITPADCDLTGRTLVSGAVRVAVPTAGNGVSASDRAADGESSLLVLTDSAGVVTISRDEHHGDEARETAPGPAPAGAAALVGPKAAPAVASACRDNNYATMGYKFNGRFYWLRNPAGTPSNIAATAGAALAQVTADVARGVNRCGYKRPVKLTQRYGGVTSRRPQITASGSCFAAGDGHSVTGWMKLPTVLAYTCSYYRKSGSKWVVSESDMALSSSFRWFTSSVPRGCRYVFDLRGVIAHERGHTFGLGHVAKSSTLTMAPYSPPCTTANRTLGNGDYRGLSAMYGVS